MRTSDRSCYCDIFFQDKTIMFHFCTSITLPFVSRVSSTYYKLTGNFTSILDITKTHVCNIQKIRSAVKTFFLKKILIVSYFLLQTLILQAVQTSTGNQCFGAKIKIIIFIIYPYT